MKTNTGNDKLRRTECNHDVKNVPDGAGTSPAEEGGASGIAAAADTASGELADTIEVAGKEREAPFPVRPEIEGFDLIEELGAGGMGVVWLARDLELDGRETAVKILKRRDRSGAGDRFEREMGILAHLDHPNLAAVYRRGTADCGPWFAMPYVKGMHLTEHAASRDLGQRERIELLLEVCAGVRYAHRRLVIHRDLKPANILVNEEGRPIVLDFGLARLDMDNGDEAAGEGDGGGDDEMPLLSEDNAVMGTIAYMSPEQARGRNQELDTRTDVFSLGVVAYELLVGEPPRDLSAPNSMSRLAKVQRLPVVPPARRATRPGRRSGGGVAAGAGAGPGRALRLGARIRGRSAGRAGEPARAGPAGGSGIDATLRAAQMVPAAPGRRR